VRPIFRIDFSAILHVDAGLPALAAAGALEGEGGTIPRKINNLSRSVRQV
jgi:hypothetical protein